MPNPEEIYADPAALFKTEKVEPDTLDAFYKAVKKSADTLEEFHFSGKYKAKDEVKWIEARSTSVAQKDRSGLN